MTGWTRTVDDDGIVILTTERFGLKLKVEDDPSSACGAVGYVDIGCDVAEIVDEDGMRAGEACARCIAFAAVYSRTGDVLRAYSMTH